MRHPVPTWTLLLGSLFAALAVVACASPEERFAKHMERANEYLEEGNRKEGLIELRNALKLQPRNADVNEQIAQVLSDLGHFEDAAFYFRETYRLDPENIEAAMSEARLLLFRDTVRAKEIIEEGLEKAPQDPAVQLARSELALVQNDTAGALEAAETGVELAPQDLGLWLQLGKVHQARLVEHRARGRNPADGIYEAAIAAFERADEIAGGSVEARVEEARVITVWPGHAREAGQAYRDAVELALEQGEPQVVLYAAEAALDFARRARDLDLSTWALRSIVDTNPDRLESWQRLAILRESQEGEGEAVYQELLEERPRDPRAHEIYATFLYNSGREGEAIAHLHETIDAGLGPPALRDRLVQFRLRRGLIQEARADLERMRDAHRDDPVTDRVAARMAIAEGRTEEGARILRALVGRAESFENFRLLALAELRLGNLEAAAASVDRALELSARFSPDATRLKARIHHEAGDWNAALRGFRALIQRNQQLSPDERLMRARGLYEAGHPHLGRRVLVRLLRREDEPPIMAAVELAKREGRRRPDLSILVLEGARKRDPTNFAVLDALTEIDVREGRHRRAIQRLNRAIAEDPVGPRVVLLRGRLYARMNMLEEAEADALRAFEAAPELPGTVDLLFALYSAQDRVDEAVRSFEEAEAAGVLHPGARLLLSRLYASRGDRAKAMEMLEKVLTERPDHPGAKNDLAFLLAHAGRDLDRALELAQEAQQGLPGNPQAADTAGYVYYRKGLYEAALQQFQYAIELASEEGRTEPVFQYHLGLTLQALGRDEEAARAFESALADGAEFAGADDARRKLESMRTARSEAPSPS